MEPVWNFSDVMNALMAAPNPIGLIYPSGLLAKETKDFEKEVKTGAIGKYDWIPQRALAG